MGLSIDRHQRPALAAVELALTCVGLYSHEKGVQNTTLRRRQERDMRERIALSLYVADVFTQPNDESCSPLVYEHRFRNDRMLDGTW